MKQSRIQTLLYSEPLEGLKIHKLSINTIRCFEIPRDCINELNKRISKIENDDYEMLNIENQGIYFLVDDREETRLYIGKSDKIIRRLIEHHQEKKSPKEFNRAFAFVAVNDEITKTFSDYLEWHYIKELKKDNLSNVTNIVDKSKKPHIPWFERSDLFSFINVIDTLLLFINISSSQNINKKINENNIFECKKAKSTYYNGKVIILKDSILPNVEFKLEKMKQNSEENTPNYKFTEKMVLKLKLLEDSKKIKKENDEEYKLLENITFYSPSPASDFATGYSSNGWDEWKNRDGKSLDYVFRKNI